MTIFTGAELPPPSVRAVQALLVYENETVRGGARYALTAHEITHTANGVQLGVARLVGLQDQQALLDILLDTLATESHFLPAEIISHSTTQLAWIVPGKIRRMWFRFGEENHRLDVPWPNLLFCAHRGSLRLAAFKRSGRPTADTPLFHAPLMNVHGHTALCTGNAILPQGWSLIHRPEYERVVFETNFTHVNHERTLLLADGNKATTRQHFRFWKTLHNDRALRFPTSALVPLKQTVADWLRQS